MILLTGNELRNAFLQFFKSKDHLVLSSFPLIPDNDPSLLLIGAGMAPFKPFFTGKMKPPHTRIATSQKCIRTGDIENVGRTARHHTFFEMLGNFSFGDYFKKEAIAWAWEFLTDPQYLNLPQDKLWITIHTDDDEAFAIWHHDIKIPAERIVRLEENFWEIGPGPCGPCSEIHIDLGEERGCHKPDCQVGCNCDRYLEIWNLVFTQFDRDEAGNYTPLAKKNIDTGAGLERIASVLQHKRSNFETDLLFPIIAHTAAIAGVTYGQSPKSDVSLKVIADHGRSLVMMIGDGVLPANEGRGYVLRRILRRAVRHGRLMGIEKPFLVPIVDIVAEMFSQAYPDISEKRDYIKKVVQLEEDRFRTTLAQGMDLLTEHVERLKSEGSRILDGSAGFKLYDTFGFPWELTQEILVDNDMELDKAGFDQAMNEQRTRARAARSDNEAAVMIPDLSGLATEKLLTDSRAVSANIVLLSKDGTSVQEVHDNEEAVIILDKTPFHAEGGGQVGDRGIITGSMGIAVVETTRKLADGTVYHLAVVTEGTIKSGEVVQLSVDTNRRRAVARNHTGTHLLHAALKQVLGHHVNQAGSLVEPDRLRFDFSHFAPVSAEQLAEIESIINHTILNNDSVNVIETTQEIAKDMGAMALFGEKYGDVVRVVMVNDFSKELCGGTHVNTTAEIGLFRIIAEGGIGSGLRRIEAVTGYGAIEYVNSRERLLSEAASVLKTRPDELSVRAESIMGRVKELEKEVEKLLDKVAQSAVDELLAGKQDIKGIQVVAGRVEAADMDGLRNIADLVRDKLVSGVVILGAVTGDKVNFVAMATKDAITKGVHAGNAVKEAAKVAGGGGGGRPDMAQAGGKVPEKLESALQAAIDAIGMQIRQ